MLVPKSKRILASVTALVLLTSCALAEVQRDVPYVPTPQPVVEEMLRLADPKEDEILYDLGCGDGRIVVTAAKKYNVKGIGVDIDPERIRESNANAKEAGVTDRVKFIEKDLFKMDFSDADVLCMYLLSSVNERLKPTILATLKPGTRVVSHAFDMGDWKADKIVHVKESGDRTVYFWVVPARVNGESEVALKTPQGEQKATLNLKQEYQYVSGTATVGDRTIPIEDGKLVGEQLTFTADGQSYTARVPDKKRPAAVNKRQAAS